MWPPESSGTWADWIAGAATFLAVVVALAQLALERRRSRIDRKRFQAEHVTAYFAQPGQPRTKASRGSKSTQQQSPGAADLVEYPNFTYVINSSDGVVYDM